MKKQQSQDQDRVVFLTGASVGIGRATAEHFLARGWRVVATMRDPSRAEWGASADRVLTLPLNVTDPSGVTAAVRRAEEAFGRIDALVNNAGFGLNGPLEALTDDQLRRQFDTNVLGLAALSRAVLPGMRRRGDGVIVNVSSIGGRVAFPFASAYHASKFAVEGFSESLRFELARFGVRVKIVEPGGIRTDFITRSGEWASHPAYAEAFARHREMAHALNDRLPGPETVAPVIYRAVTDRSGRLRYRAQAGPYLALRAMLGDGLWRRMVGAMLDRHAGAPRPATV